MKPNKPSIFKIIKNFFFCLRYPFFKSRNVWTGKFLGYGFTWYDFIPEGWRKAFGKQLCKELRNAWKLSGKEDFFFTQIKEKYGELRLYIASGTDAIYEVLHKYENMSHKYCISCGRPVEYKYGYYNLCEKCFLEELHNHSFENEEELLKYIQDMSIDKDKEE